MRIFTMSRMLLPLKMSLRVRMSVCLRVLLVLTSSHVSSCQGPGIVRTRTPCVSSGRDLQASMIMARQVVLFLHLCHPLSRLLLCFSQEAQTWEVGAYPLCTCRVRI